MKQWLALAIGAASCTPVVATPVEPVAKVVRAPESPVVVVPDELPRATIAAFLAAVEARRFDAALALLGRELRERYTTERLSIDFFAEPLATERVARLRAHVGEPLIIDGDRAQLPLGGTKAAELHREAGEWKLVRLE